MFQKPQNYDLGKTNWYIVGCRRLGLKYWNHRGGSGNFRHFPCIFWEHHLLKPKNRFMNKSIFRFVDAFFRDWPVFVFKLQSMFNMLTGDTRLLWKMYTFCLSCDLLFKWWMTCDEYNTNCNVSTCDLYNFTLNSDLKT
jgi:hypothetical protein